jgi:hypothetical protein
VEENPLEIQPELVSITHHLEHAKSVSGRGCGSGQEGAVGDAHHQSVDTYHRC